MQGLEVDVPWPVTVCCTNTSKFVGAEGPSDIEVLVTGPLESSIPTYLSTNTFHAGAFMLPQPST
jgi:hypothetical protein